MERNINIQNTAARLRKTFQYPTDESSENNTPEALDEEEQETLITTLATQNATRNNQFRHLLLLIPLIASTPYLLTLISPPPNTPRSTTSLLSLLALSSLASTTFLVFRLNPTLTGFSLLDSLSGSTSTSSPFDDDDDDDDGGRRRRRRRRSSLSANMSVTSPLETYLPYLNGGLCVLAVLMGWVLHQQGHEEGVSSLWLGGLPGIIYGAVIVAKMVMAGVDPERELSALRYEFKGA